MPPPAWHLAACAAALLLLAPVALAVTESVDVCVVGAGPSGIGAALALADKGKTVALLERDDRAGGQTKPEYVHPETGFRTHQGAIFLTPADYPTVLRYATRVGLGIELYSSDPIATSFVLRDGDSQPMLLTAPDSPYNERLRTLAADFRGFLNACRRFSVIYKKLKPTLFKRGGLPAVLRAAPELAANMDAWLEDNDLSLLNPIAAQVLLQTGYGHLYETSAASALQYLSPYTLLAGLASSGVDTSKFLTAGDRLGFNHSVYMFDDDVGFGARPLIQTLQLGCTC